MTTDAAPLARLAAPPATPALAVAGLTADYAGAPAIEAVTATFPGAALTAIVGPNGAGKSTLIKAALGLVPSQGAVRFFGTALDTARARVAYMPQRAGVDWDFPLSAFDVVATGLYRRTGPFRRLTRADRALAMDALSRVGLADLARRQIGALSGGQQQRVFLARALAQGADLYLLDEPFAGVDAATEAAIMGVLRALRDAGAAVVAVHHDLATVSDRFDRVLMLNRRVVAEGPVAETFTADRIGRTYAPVVADAA
ncbi:MAG: metal ABC transporter ATP-binding protein [Paracoccaceae bacterium]|nr:MAG: metal ABC transporter ATP-binding protein [Paracoccaceae bacterium]